MVSTTALGTDAGQRPRGGEARQGVGGEGVADGRVINYACKNVRPGGPADGRAARRGISGDPRCRWVRGGLVAAAARLS